jgi:hypothetical protein
MALDRQIARLAKILVDSKGISFDEAQDWLRGLTLEVVVGLDAMSPAAHAAILTSVSVASRTFVGGVRVTGAINQPLNLALPLSAETIAEAVTVVGATSFNGAPSRRIFVGTSRAPKKVWSISPWWHGWCAGTVNPSDARWDKGDNPLTGIAAGAMAVGAAFEAQRGHRCDLRSEVNLWPVVEGEIGPSFSEVFLPGALWLVGLGNLGQAFLWALAALPYSDPAEVSLVLQDRDKVTEENWATSVLVRGETYGTLKTKVAEQWALHKGFNVRRIDRRLLASDRLDSEDPRLALSGVDKIEARKLMAEVGFDCIVDAGLGRTSSNFDRYRVTVFDHIHPIDRHFATLTDEPVDEAVLKGEAYRRLEAEIGHCGTAEIGGASVAAPYVSALAAAVSISRAIAVVSGCLCPTNEVGRLSSSAARKFAPLDKFACRGLRHAGKPANTDDRIPEHSAALARG